MNKTTLRKCVEDTGSNYFDRKTMRFFGDTMKNYGVLREKVIVTTWSGESVECWELFRKRLVKFGLHDSAYFDCKTFERVHPRKITETV